MASVSKLNSGKWRVQVRRGGIYRAKTFDRKAEATAWGVETEKAISNTAQTGTVIAPKGMTLAHVIDAYLKQVQCGRSVQFDLERIRKRIGSTQISALDDLVVRKYIDSRKADGVAGATLACDLSQMSSMLKWARYVRHLDIDPELAKRARQSLTAERIDTRSVERERIPTQDELDQLVAYFDANLRQQIPMGDIVKFGAASAMRIAEICRIQIEDISWNEKTVIIRERKDPRRKARNNQTVPLIGEAYELARKHAQGRTSGTLFPYSEKSASTAFTRACKKLNIVDLRFHDLRHLAITELFRAGLPMELVAVVSGHRDWKHLKRYTQLNAHDVHAKLAQLGSHQ